MKKLFKTSLILLSLLSVLFVSCKKEYEIPPIQVLPVGDVYTIGDLLAMPANTTFDTASVYGIVTADEKSGNLYKTIFIQDRATGKAIELLMNTSSAARIGDSVRVYLNEEMMVNNYHNLPQIVGADGKGFNPDGHLIIYPYNKPIDPVVVTIADIKTGNYTAGLVKIENAMFLDQGVPFCNVGENTNRSLKDATGELLVRTSNYANFAYDLIPAGSGSLVAIASVYNNDWQLLIRSKTELDFEGGEPTPPAPAGEVQHLPYLQSFSSDFGTYTTYDVLGDQKWEIDYNTAKITGFVNSTYYANEDWLISSPVDLTEVTEATMTMTYIGRYFNNFNEDVTIWVSTDYTYESNPTEATWAPVPARLSEASSWSDFLTTDISLNDYVGQTVTVAVKYVSTETKAGTIEIQSIGIVEGGSTPPTPPTPTGEVQSLPYIQSFATEFGTYMPIDVNGDQGWVIDYSTAKMTGFVSSTYYANEDWLVSSPVDLTTVSEAKMTMVYIGRYFSNINEDITIWASTDYVFGNELSTATWSQVPSSLQESSSWSEFKTAEISLVDVAGQSFAGQTATFAVKYVSTDSKAGTIEIQSITIEEGSGVTPTPPGPTPVPTLTGDGSRENPYTANDIIILGIENSDGNKYWVKDYIVGFVDANYNYVFSANNAVATNLTLSSNVNASSDSESIPVQLPAGEVRTGLNLVDHPDNLGQEVLLYGTLEKYFRVPAVKNVTYAEINGNSFGTDPGGGDPPTPGETIFSETFASGQGDFTIENVLLPSELTFVWAHASNYSCMKASAYVGQAYETESWLVSPYIDLADVNTATLSFEQAVNYASPDGVLSVMITTEYEGTVDGIEWEELQLSAWPAGSNWTFISSTADLTPYAGQRVTIAFKYTSTSSASATWEVKNFVVE